jgi:alpha-mannosidase
MCRWRSPKGPAPCRARRRELGPAVRPALVRAWRSPPAPRWLHWDEQGEATLFVNGVPFYGFDVAHRYCELPAGTREVWVESLCVQSAIWHPDAKGLGAEGNIFRGARLLRRDDEAWAAYHDLNCLYDWMLDLRAREFPGVPRELFSQTQQPALTDVSPLYRRLLRGLDTALDAFDTAGVAALRRELAKLYRELRDPAPLSRAALSATRTSTWSGCGRSRSARARPCTPSPT